MKDELQRVWRRYGRLLSILQRTSERLGDPKLLIRHTDPSLLAFNPLQPCPWLGDVGQIQYLLENHKQITQLGRGGVLSRLLLIPRRNPIIGPWRFSYFAAVRAVIHLQLYEGVRLWVAFVPLNAARDLSFSLSLERIGHHTRVWPSTDYYGAITTHEAEEAAAPVATKLLKDVDAAMARSIAIAPYREEHFRHGERIELPSSWRRFLFLMNDGKCEWCSRSLNRYGFHIDHGRALHPENDQCRPTPNGNSNIFNLGALCQSCNSKKSNKNVVFPEMFINAMIPEPRVAEYFRASLQTSPHLLEHRLPETAPAEGQFR